MARVTVEDCVQKVPNRFELVLLAAQRARNLEPWRGTDDRPRQRQEPGRCAARDRRRDDRAAASSRTSIKSLSRAPEPEPADEEVLDLIPTDQNIFGLQDVTAEEEAANLPVEGEECRPTTSRRRSRPSSAAAAAVDLVDADDGGRRRRRSRSAPALRRSPDGD